MILPNAPDHVPQAVWCIRNGERIELRNCTVCREEGAEEIPEELLRISDE